MISGSETRAEVVVVGSGPGGAITACMLAEAGKDVLLLEEGLPHRPEDAAPFSVEEMALKYRNGGITPTFGQPKVAYVEGRCVGGGSEINSGLYHRTPVEILERWQREFGVEGITPKEMLPHFETCERELSVGLLPQAAPPASIKLHAGAEKLGWKSLEVPRWSKYQGDSERPGQFKEERQSMSRTYIPRFLKAGGKLETGVRITRIAADGANWVARGERAGQRVAIRAERLFLCAGATQTPSILRRSGLGRNIGRTLQLHPTIKITAQFAEEVNSAEMGVPVHQVKEFSPRLSFGCSISSRAYLALGLLDSGNDADVEGSWRRMANYYAMITSEARGSVHVLPGFNDPFIRYRLSDADLRNLADGLKKLGEILFASGAQALYPSISGWRKICSKEDFLALGNSIPRERSNLMSIHLFSSCPMGETNACAADSYGRLHGLKGLYVNDASLLCTAPGVNPQGSVMAIARRNALHFLESTAL